MSPKPLDKQLRKPLAQVHAFDPYRAATISFPPPKTSTTTSSIIETPRPLHYITSRHITSHYNIPQPMPSNPNTIPDQNQNQNQTSFPTQTSSAYRTKPPQRTHTRDTRTHSHQTKARTMKAAPVIIITRRTTSEHLTYRQTDQMSQM